MTTAMTAAAGEHFVAYRLSSLGLLAALTRGGSPTVDVLVGDPAGHAAISLQVKTSNWARKEYKRDPSQNHWEWFVGKKALSLRSASIYYAFVDLKGGDLAIPDVFVVPSAVVADAFAGEERSAYLYWLMDAVRGQYLEAWQPIVQRLSTSADDSADDGLRVPDQDCRELGAVESA